MLTFLAVTLAARPAAAETLADVVAYAYETNPSLQAQRAALRALDESYVQARSGYGLNISGSAAETSYDEHLNETTGPTHFYANTPSESISAVQPIYTGGRVHSRMNEAEAQILAGREELRRLENDLLQRAVTAYVNVRRDEELLKINQDTVKVLERELGDTQGRFQEHDVTMTDVAQAKARLAQARTSLSSAMEALAVSRTQFLGTIGQSPVDLAPPPPLDTLPTTISQALDAAENNSPQLLAAEYTEQGSRAKIVEAKAQALPSISAQFSLQHTPYVPYQTRPYNDAASAMVTISQTFFTGGQIASGVRQAIEENNRDRLEIDDARQQVVVGVSSAWEQLAAARSQLHSLDDEVHADEFAFYGVHEEYKFALHTTLDVLNAELELTTAQQNLARSRALEYTSRVQLLAVVGVLTPELLGAKVRVYDPAANYRLVRNKGATPLEWPARALDALGAPRIGPNPPASIAEANPEGTTMPPAPGVEAPIQSILSTLSKPPPEPR